MLAEPLKRENFDCWKWLHDSDIKEILNPSAEIRRIFKFGIIDVKYYKRDLFILC